MPRCRRPPLVTRLRGWACALVLLAAAGGARGEPARHDASTPPGVLQRAIAVNRIAMQVTNCGSFASDHLMDGAGSSYGGLEYPRGSGKLLAYAAGLWFSGRASGALRTAITEYATEFVPGPATPGGPGLDTLRHRVWSASRSDTTGWGEWMARAVPLGAPVDSSGTRPGISGDATLWTVCTDAGVTAQLYGRGPRTPIGLEVQLTAYAFDRAPVLQDVVFLHFRIVHRGSETLDSAYVGLWYDADMRTAETPAASDSSLDLGYVYRTTDDVEYGAAGPATGMMLLRGPRPALRATAIVGYENGVDPASAEQYDATLHGLYPWGDAMVDSTTLLPTLYYASGDPVTGSGWLMPAFYNPKLAVAAGPFPFAPGDTQVVDAAVVVGQGADRAGSVVALRANAREARDAFDTGFALVPPPPPPPTIAIAALRAHPVPARGAVQLDVDVPGAGARVRLEVFDVRGRSVRRLADAWQAGGTFHGAWDGATGAGRRAPAGVYFVRARVAGRDLATRAVLLP